MFLLVESGYERVKGTWDERFESSYGFWRSFVEETVYAFQSCGDFGQGFARVKCSQCQAEFLVAMSCKRRGFCASCAAKRAAIFGAFLREEVLEEVPHAMWTFTIPKMLRRYFLNHRELLGKLARVAFETVQDQDLRCARFPGSHDHAHTSAPKTSNFLLWMVFKPC